METTETTYEVGDIVRATIPQRSGGVYTYTGPITGKRTMKATGKTYYRAGMSAGITADMLEKVAVTSRTRRSPDGMFATGGAIRQDGSLPIYVCNACNQEVVWATSSKTGRKYLVNISRGYLDQRFYAKHNIHRCPTETESS